jgi:vitamin B12 transporter
MKHAMRIGLSLAIVLGGQSIVLADEAAPTDGAYRLGEIVVSAKPESIAEHVGTVYRVTGSDIKEQGARTLNEALQLVPGIIIREGAEGTPRIDIRGFRTRHVQLFLNGIPIRDTYDGQFDPTLVPAEIISEIKVTSGGGSVLYGPGGNGGAIDIITKSGEEGMHGSLGTEIAEGGNYGGHAAIYGASEKVDFYANFNVQNRDSFMLSDDFEPVNAADEDGGSRENSDWKRVNLFTNLSYRLTDYTTLGLTFSHVDGENGKPPVTNADDDDIFAKSLKFERVDEIKSSLLQVAFSHKTKGPLDVRGWAYYSQTDLEENGYDDDTYSSQKGQGSLHQETDTEIVGVNTQFLYHVDDAATATLALGAENESWESEGFENKKKGFNDLADDRDLQTYSVALEYERELWKKVGMVVGYGHHFYNRDDADDNDFSYLIGATYDMSDETRFRLNHSRKIRFPSLKQLYGSGGNPALDTEVTLHYEAGIEQQLPANTTLNVTGFVIDAEDFIEKDESDINQNFQELSFKGIETDLKIYPIDDLLLRLAVTWLETEDKSADSGRDDLQYRPKWTVTTEAKYRFSCGLTAYGSIQHVADQYFYDDVDATQKKKLNDITVANLKFSQTVLESGLEIYAGVDNLFDKDYEESYGLPQPGRTIYGGIEYRF